MADVLVKDPKTGKFALHATINEDELKDQYLQGNVAFRHPKQAVFLRGPDGAAYKGEAGQAADAYKAGYEPISEAEFKKADDEARYGGLGGQVGTVAAGLARGVAGGLSDKAIISAAGAIKPDYATKVREHLAGYQRTNPKLNTVSEVAGLVLPNLVPGVGEAVDAERLAARGAEAAITSDAAKAVSGGEAALDAVKTPEVLATQQKAAQEAAGLTQPESALEAAQRVQQPAAPVIGPNGPIDPAITHTAPLPPPGVAPPMSDAARFGVTPPKTIAEAGDHAVSRIVEQPGIGRTILQHTPAAYIGKAGRTIEGAVTELLGEGASKTLTGRVVGSAIKYGLSGSVEQGLISVGSEMSEEAIDGDPELNGQKLLAAATHGAILGAAFGGALGGGGTIAAELGNAALRKASPMLTRLYELQTFRAFSSGGGRSPVAKEAIKIWGPEGPQILARTANKYDLVKFGSNVEKIFEDTESAHSKVGEALNGPVAAIEQFAKKPDLVTTDKLHDVLFGVNGYEKDPLIETLHKFRDIKGNLVGLTDEERALLPEMEAQLSPTVRDESGRVIQRGGELYDNLESAEAEFTKHDEIRRRLRQTPPEEVEQLGFSGAKTVTDGDIYEFMRHHQPEDIPTYLKDKIVTPETVAAVSERQNYLRDLRNAARGSLSSAESDYNKLLSIDKDSLLQRTLNVINKYANPDGTFAPTAFRQARIEIQDQVKTWIPKDGAAEAFPQQLMKYIRGKMEEQVIATGDKVASREGGKVATEWDKYRPLKDDYRKLSFLKKKAEASLAAHLNNQHISLTGKMLGLGELVHGGIAAMPKAILLTLAHKVIRDRGTSASAAILGKLSTLSYIQKTTAAVDRQITHGVDSMLGRMTREPGARAPRGALRGFGRSEQVPEDYLEARDKAHSNMVDATKLANLPTVKAEHVAAALGGNLTHAPLHAQSVASYANLATQALMANLPDGHSDFQNIVSGPQKGRISDAALSDFKNFQEGATDLPATLRKIAIGRVTLKHMEGMKKALPGIHDMIVAEIAKSLSGLSAEQRSRISMGAQSELSIILGIPTSWAYQPSAIKMFQSADVQITQSDGRPAQGQQAPGRPAPSQLKNMGSDMRTPSDSLNSGGLLGPRTGQQ